MEKTVSLGVDIGSISTKGVLLSENNNIVSSAYIWTEGDPLKATKELVRRMCESLPNGYAVNSAGTTGSARALIGAMLSADVVKNEITAHAVGTLMRYPETRTIIEIGGQDSKLILINEGVVIDYAMNTLCAAGTGAFLSSQAKRLNIRMEDLGEIAMRSEMPARIAARCTVFAESDMIHKAQAGYKKEDLVAGLCLAVVSNYLNNVGKGKRLEQPVVFQGGVSKNAGVTEAFRRELGCDITVDEDSHLMGAIGSAVLARKYSSGKPFDPSIINTEFSTRARECSRCPNNCEIVEFYGDGKFIELWGNRCEKGSAK